MNRTKIELGSIKRDANYRKYMWVECEDCHKPRWVVLYQGSPQSPMCRQCAPSHRPNSHYKRGKDNPDIQRQIYLIVAYYSLMHSPL